MKSNYVKYYNIQVFLRYITILVLYLFIVQQFTCGTTPVLVQENVLISSGSFSGCPSLSQTFSAQPGQRLNASMIDFTWDESRSSNCIQNVGTIRDTISSNAAQLCSGRERNRHVMVSNGNSVEIRINAGIQKPNFILEITGQYFQ